MKKILKFDKSLRSILTGINQDLVSMNTQNSQIPPWDTKKIYLDGVLTAYNFVVKMMIKEYYPEIFNDYDWQNVTIDAKTSYIYITCTKKTDEKPTATETTDPSTSDDSAKRTE